MHASDLEMGRVTNFSNWVPEINNNEKSTIVALEYWSYDDDVIWKKSDQDLIELAKSEMTKTGLIRELK